MKDKKKLIYISTFSIVVVFLIITIIFFIAGKGKLDLNSDLVKDLYGYFDNNNLYNCNGLSNYSDKEFLSKNLNYDTKLCYIYNHLEEGKLTNNTIKKGNDDTNCKISKNIHFKLNDKKTDECFVKEINDSDIEKLYKTMFNQKIKHETFNASSNILCFYDKTNKKYICGDPVNEIISGVEIPEVYRVLKEAKKENNQIIIYDYFLAIENNKCFTSFTKNNENKECSKNIINKNINTSIIKKYGQIYKHTFKLNDDHSTYSWVSSLPYNN